MSPWSQLYDTTPRLCGFIFASCSKNNTSAGLAKSCRVASHALLTQWKRTSYEPNYVAQIVGLSLDEVDASRFRQAIERQLVHILYPRRLFTYQHWYIFL
jgi:hypothetical protein